MKLKSKTKRTLSAATFVTACILAILLFNIVVGAAADKIRLRFDLTANKIYALTDETKTVLKNLEEDVVLYYFASAGYENAQVVRTLDMYKTASDKLKIIQEDPNTNPISIRRFTDKGIQIQQNSIVLERGERYREISPGEIYQSHTTQSGNTLNNAYFGLEQLITRAIAYVASEKTQRIAFTTGHNEIDYSAVLETLRSENAEVYQVDLKTEELPASLDAVYIMAPTNDFTEDEILKIDAFLSAGKGVHVSFDARKKPVPLLEKYLEEYWGITMYHDLVCEGDSARTLNYMYMFMPKLEQHAVTESIVSGNQNAVFMYTRSMSVGTAEDVTPTVLASTSDAAFSVHGSDQNHKDYIREGVMPVAVALERASKEGYDRGRMVVSGSYQIYDSFFISETAFANRDFLYGAVKFLNHDDSAALSISPKSLFIRMIMISDAMTIFYIIAICVLPSLICFAAGIYSFKKRRNL